MCVCVCVREREREREEERCEGGIYLYILMNVLCVVLSWEMM